MSINNLSAANLTVISGSAMAQPGKAAAKPSKLHEAAQQFESLMINEMLKSVKESSSSGWLGSEGDSGSESAMEMAQGQFATALAKSGGLGLARMIEKSVSPTAVSPKLSAAPSPEIKSKI